MAGTTAVWLAVAAAGGSTLRGDMGGVVNRISPWMYGPCIEGADREISGGPYPQRLFGERFEGPPAWAEPGGWSAFGGRWRAQAGVLAVGAQAVRDGLEIGDRAVACSVRIGAGAAEDAGLTLRVRPPRTGADARPGYEVSVYPKAGTAVLGRPPGGFPPAVADPDGRFAVTIDGPGMARIDQATLGEGGPGPFRGLPIRADLALAMAGPGAEADAVWRLDGDAPGRRRKAFSYRILRIRRREVGGSSLQRGGRRGNM